MRADFDQAGGHDEPLWVSYVDLVEVSVSTGRPTWAEPVPVERLDEWDASADRAEAR
jgi:hypothetical protein